MLFNNKVKMPSAERKPLYLRSGITHTEFLEKYINKLFNIRVYVVI